MRLLEQTKEEDFYPVKLLANQWNCTIQDALFRLKGNSNIYVLLFRVGAFTELLHRKDQIVVQLLEEMAEQQNYHKFYKFLHVKLPEDIVLRLLTKSSFKVEHLDVERGDGGGELVKIIRYLPSGEDYFDLSHESLYIKRDDLGRLNGVEGERERKQKYSDKAVLKLVGALILLNYNSRAYKKSEGCKIPFHKSAIVNSIINKLDKLGYTPDGIKDSNLKKIISDGLEAIEENKI